MQGALKGLALMLSLALVGWVLAKTDMGNLVNEAWIDAHVRGHGLTGALTFLLAAAIFTAVGLPRQLIAFLGGYAFEAGLGTALAVLGTLFGCILGFAFARCFAQSVLRERLGTRAARFDRLVSRHPLAMTMLVRLLPVGNNLLTNMAAGISSIRALPFFLGSLIGYLPQTLAFALAGSGAQMAPGEKLALGAALFVGSAALGQWLYRRLAASACGKPSPANGVSHDA